MNRGVRTPTTTQGRTRKPRASDHPPVCVGGVRNLDSSFLATPNAGDRVLHPTLWRKAPTSGAGYPGSPSSNAGDRVLHPTLWRKAPTSGAGYPGSPSSGVAKKMNHGLRTHPPTQRGWRVQCMNSTQGSPPKASAGPALVVGLRDTVSSFLPTPNGPDRVLHLPLPKSAAGVGCRQKDETGVPQPHHPRKPRTSNFGGGGAYPLFIFFGDTEAVNGRSNWLGRRSRNRPSDCARVHRPTSPNEPLRQRAE